MIATNMCSNFGGKWIVSPFKCLRPANTAMPANTIPANTVTSEYWFASEYCMPYCYARKCCYAIKYCYANVPDRLRDRNAHMEIWLREKCFV